MRVLYGICYCHEADLEGLFLIADRPVCIPDQSLQVVEIHESEFADGRLQVEVYDMLSAHPLQILAVAHPGQVVNDLLVPWDLEAIPAHQS